MKSKILIDKTEQRVSEGQLTRTAFHVYHELNVIKLNVKKLKC